MQSESVLGLLPISPLPHNKSAVYVDDWQEDYKQFRKGRTTIFPVFLNLKLDLQQCIMKESCKRTQVIDRIIA